MINAAFIVLGFILVGILLSAFVAFDVLIKLMYRDHKSEWEANGHPTAMFWRPEEVGWFAFRSDFAMKRLQFLWLFKTPEWIRHDASAMRLLWWLRAAVAFWNLSIVALGVMMLIRR
jgi:hypothetical protein